jgi:prepilin-type N-terminal cleavage/methylation domain-containing protein
MRQLKLRLTKKTPGFSLIELLIAISVIIILISISIPTITAYQKSLSLNTEATKLIGKLRLAQQRAISEQSKYSLELNPELNNYSLINNQNSSTIETIDLPADLQLTDLSGFLNNRATFNPIGAVDYEGQFSLQNQTGLSILIQVKSSGYISYTKQ